MIQGVYYDSDTYLNYIVIRTMHMIHDCKQVCQLKTIIQNNI